LNDEKCYLLFWGYHSVAAASDRLNGHYIENEIVRAPVKISNGCSFAVMINKNDMEMSKILLDKQIKGINCL